MLSHFHAPPVQSIQAPLPPQGKPYSQWAPAVLHDEPSFGTVAGHGAAGTDPQLQSGGGAMHGPLGHCEQRQNAPLPSRQRAPSLPVQSTPGAMALEHAGAGLHGAVLGAHFAPSQYQTLRHSGNAESP